MPSEPILHTLAPAANGTAVPPAPAAGAAGAGAHDAFSEAPGDAQNRVAQAGNAAAHHAEPAQKVPANGAAVPENPNLTKLVAEENASKSNFPRYPGLERWELTEKMGDGAFSNVYRATDTQGQYPNVAIKVVRKYEMNSMQVSWLGLFTSFIRSLSLSLSLVIYSLFSLSTLPLCLP